MATRRNSDPQARDTQSRGTPGRGPQYRANQTRATRSRGQRSRTSNRTAALGRQRTFSPSHGMLEELEQRQMMTVGIPVYDHVVIVIEENHSQTNIIGNANAPYMNLLASEGTSFTDMHALTHPSQPNYLNLFSGSTQGSTSDNVPTTPASLPTTSSPFTTPNLGVELRKAGYSFGSYSEGLPSVGSQVTSSGQYWRKHNPVANWQDNAWTSDANPPVNALPNTLPQSLNMPFTSFPSAANFANLPTVSYVVPNQDHDMHDGTIAQADTWLQQNIDAYAQWAKTHNSLLIVTWDEDDFASGNIIPTIFYGQGVKQGDNDAPRDHLNLLRTIEDMYDLRTNPSNAGNLTPVGGSAAITDVWTDAPNHLQATVTSANRVDLAWQDNSQEEVGFSIERAIGAGPFVVIGAEAANTGSYIDTSVTPGVAYSYRIRAITSFTPTYTEYSEIVSTKTSVPSAPQGTAAAAGSTPGITLSWSDSSNNTNGFRIERSTNGGPFFEIGDVDRYVTQFTDFGALEGRLESYRVKAYNGVGESTYSPTASATITAAPPTAVLYSPVDNGVADFDPTVGVLSVGPQSQFIVQLSDIASDIDDSSIVAASIALSRGGVALAQGTEYLFSYDAANDRITVSAAGPSFPVGAYHLTISAGNQVQDLVGNALAPKLFEIVVNSSTPVSFPTPLTALSPLGSAIYTGSVAVAAESSLFAGTSFEEPALHANTYTPGVGAQELGWTRTITNGTPGANAVFGVENTANGLGAPAFPPANGSTKAYVSRGNTAQTLETLTFNPVTLTGRTDVTFSIDVFRANTFYEAADSINIFLVLSDGVSTVNQSVLNLTTGNVGTTTLLTSGAYRTLTASIGAQYTTAQLVIQSSNNSGQNPPDEVYVYDNIQFRGTGASGGNSTFSLFLDAGQTLTADLTPAADFRPQVQIVGPGAATTTVSAAQAGSEVVVQTYAAPVAGRYLVTISALDNTFGTATLRLYANAALEMEPHGGPTNNNFASAQNIDSAFAAVTDLADRAGVVGATEAGASDYYSFTLAADETAAIAVKGQSTSGFKVDLFDSSGAAVAKGIAASNVNQVINYFKSATGGTYYIQVSGSFASNYGLVVLRNALFDQESSSGQFLPLNLTQAQTAVGYLDPNSGFGSDYYRLDLKAGQYIHIETSTPGGGALEFPNLADPDIDLYDANFNLVLEELGDDGVNVDENYDVTTTGVYYLRVFSNVNAGEYAIEVTGTDRQLPPFAVSDTTPGNGQAVQAPPTFYTVNFDRPVTPASVQAADLTVGGVAATAVTVIDGDSAVFTLPSLPAASSYAVAIAAGAISDVQGGAIAAYAGLFSIDTIAPRVVASSIQENAVLPPGVLTYVVQFSERMATSNLDASDFTLQGDVGSQVYTPQSFSYDPTGTTLTISYVGLPDDHYKLTLLSAAGAFQDLSGRLLDGEPAATPMPPAVSGNGIDGGNFAVGFYLDTVTQALPTLVAQAPKGSLIYTTSSSGGISLGDTDQFTLSLEAGQKISIAVTPTSTLQPHLAIQGPGGITNFAAPAVGQECLVQLFTVAVSGQYSFTIAGSSATTGGYRLDVALNAAFESEAHGGAANETLSSAQSLDAGALPLGGSAWHAAVIGNLVAPSGAPGPQYASSVIGFSSEYSTTSWSAAQALGAPNVGAYGDNSSAWSARGSNDGPHYLAVGFAQPAVSNGVHIRESNGNGFVTQVDVLDVNDVYHTVWTGVDNSPSTIFDFSPTWPMTDYLVKGVKIYVNTDHDQTTWEEIDSVQLQSPFQIATDYYSLHATSGETLSLSSKGATGVVVVELVDAGGVSLASGVTGSSNVDSSIVSYVVPTSGMYYAKVSGAAGSDYNLVVLHNSTLGLEPNNTLAAAQDLSTAHLALGYVSGHAITGGSPAPAPLTAVTLPLALIDGASFNWDIQGDGSISDGTNDAYDGGMVHTGFNYVSSGATEDAGREVLIGPQTISQVQVSRKIYVPTDQGYARYLEIVRNPTASTLNYTVNIATNLGSDSGTQLVQTSSGDATFSTADDWIVTDDSDGSGDPSLLHVLAGPDAMRPNAVSAPAGSINYAFNLTLAPGQTQIVMHFASQNSNRAAALAKGPALDSLGLGALAGLSDDELSQIVNFTAADIDDYYSIVANAGDTIDLRTNTPGDSAGSVDNALDPLVTLFDTSGEVLASDDNSADDGRNAHLRFTVGETGVYKVHVTSMGGPGEYVLQATATAAPQVVARHVFYNNSAWDRTTGPSASDDLAIASDKTPLLPGATATFANYTSYSRGVNGLMIDIAGLAASDLSDDDFSFRVGNDSDPEGNGWSGAPGPTSITVRAGAGVDGSDRVTLIWADGAIQKQWLQVTVLDNGNTGLTAPDVFYFGNAVGDTGVANAPGYGNVNAMDEVGARSNPKTSFPVTNQAAIDFVYDFNRDKQVNPADQLIARNNGTTLGANALVLITAPGNVAFATALPVRALAVTSDSLSVRDSSPESAVDAAIAQGFAAPVAAPVLISPRGVQAGSRMPALNPLPIDRDDALLSAVAASVSARHRATQSDWLDVALDGDWLDALAQQRAKKVVGIR